MGKHIKLNIITTILNVLIAGGSYFIVYKLLLKYVGVEELGVWSLVLASSSIANLANFGLTSSVVKFVASFNAQVDKKNEINKLLFTSTILMASIFIVVALILFVFSDFLLSTIIPLKHLLLAKALLPISLSCLVMNAIGGIFTSGLEGFQKNYIKNIIYVGASMLFIGFSYIFIQKLGLIGVAYAQLIQSLFILLFSLITLKFVCPAFTLLQWQWEKSIFKEIFNYGMKFQVISFSQLLFDPMTKVLLGHFGGLGMVGYYEMANRLVMQVRGLIVNANQVMVPVVADLNEKNTNSIKSLYKETLSVVILFTVPSMAFLISNTDLISLLWIDAINDTFWLLVSLVSLSMLVNILAGPSYFTFLGIGKLNPLLAAQLIMGVCNLVLGYSFGQLFLGIGVIIGMVFSIIIASIYLIYFFHRSYLVELNSIINKDSIFLFIAFIINFFAVIAIRKYYINQEMLIFTFSFLSFIIVFIPCIIMNNSFRNKILPVFTKKRV